MSLEAHPIYRLPISRILVLKHRFRGLRRKRGNGRSFNELWNRRLRAFFEITWLAGWREIVEFSGTESNKWHDVIDCHCIKGQRAAAIRTLPARFIQNLLFLTESWSSPIGHYFLRFGKSVIWIFLTGNGSPAFLHRLINSRAW